MPRLTITSSIRAILAICAAFLALFTSVGFLNAFGVFQDYYQTHELNEYSASDISWIGSASISILYIASPLSGILADKLGPRVSDSPFRQGNHQLNRNG